MEIENLKLTRVKINEANPREIKQDKFHKLVDSILVFPKMLGIRPAVIDKEYKLLGGNQRTQALKFIAKMTIEDIADRLCEIADFANKTEAERKVTIEFWSDWLDNPFVPVLRASTLTEDEKRQFIIKDNVSFGTWDYDMLAGQWDNDKLQNWGVDVWNTKPAPETNDEPAQENTEPDFTGQLPPVLDGVDLNPDDLPKLRGTDERPSDYVIITYMPEDKAKLLDFLGIKEENWNEKVCYSLDEILFMKEGGEQ